MNKTRILYNDSYALLGSFKTLPSSSNVCRIILGFDNAALSSQFLVYVPFTMCVVKLTVEKNILVTVDITIYVTKAYGIV
jgi:hypothetical protein